MGTYGGVDPPDGTLAHRDARVVHRGEHRGEDGRGGGRAAARGERPIRDHGDVQAAPGNCSVSAERCSVIATHPLAATSGYARPVRLKTLGP